MTQAAETHSDDALAHAFLARWHAAVAAKDASAIDALLAEDPAISSPAYWTPKRDRAYVKTILTAVLFGLEDFTYTKDWVDGREIILEFTGRVGDKGLKGIDRITLDAQGRLEHIEVLIRPVSGLMALADLVKGAFQEEAK